MSGFPVVWVGTNDGWYGSVDLNITMALRNSLQQAIIKVQNEAEFFTPRFLEVSSILLDEKVPVILEIPTCEERIKSENLVTAGNLEREWHRLLVFELGRRTIFKGGNGRGIWGFGSRGGIM